MTKGNTDKFSYFIAAVINTVPASALLEVHAKSCLQFLTNIGQFTHYKLAYSALLALLQEFIQIVFITISAYK